MRLAEQGQLLVAGNVLLMDEQTGSSLFVVLKLDELWLEVDGL